MVRLNAAHQSGVPIAPRCEWAEHKCWAPGASRRGRAGSERACGRGQPSRSPRPYRHCCTGR
eukprot:3365408-Pleurochrysis_carterae.AAC.1